MAVGGVEEVRAHAKGFSQGWGEVFRGVGEGRGPDATGCVRFTTMFVLEGD